MYKWLSDPGHAWLMVPLSDVVRYGFLPTEFSFFDKTTAYLEEDCDAPTFLAIKYRKDKGIDFRPDSEWTRSIIAPDDTTGAPPRANRFPTRLTEMKHYDTGERFHTVNEIDPYARTE